jgi:hypothetical protein
VLLLAAAAAGSGGVLYRTRAAGPDPGLPPVAAPTAAVPNAPAERKPGEGKGQGSKAPTGNPEGGTPREATARNDADGPAGPPELATVGGKVIFNGKPLTDSVITFHLDDGQFVGGRVKEGRFLVKRVPAGTWKVTIESKALALPAKFAAPETSGMSAEVKKGQVAVNFMLSD